jgi:hypothetical protein
MIAAAKVIKAVSPIGDIQNIEQTRPLTSIKDPENCPIGQIPESRLRPLTGLLPEQKKEVYQQAVDTAPEGKVTAKHVQDTVERMKARKRLGCLLPLRGLINKPYDALQPLFRAGGATTTL